MMQPDFFIVGAPKCGTTALSEYLSTHPDIFMSEPKEPHYFAMDFPRNRFVDSPERYAALFRKVRAGEVCGEASVWYLYSDHAISAIHSANPSARIVVALRNPVNMVISLHAENFFNFNEDVKDFELAYDLQQEREEGSRLPPDCRQPRMVQYTRLGRYSRWLKRVLDVFPRSQVHVFVLEEFVANPEREYRRLLEFLGVADDHRREFPRVNERREYRIKSVGYLTQHPPVFLRHFAKSLREYTGIDLRQPALLLRRLVTQPWSLPEVPLSVREKVWADVADDIPQLEELLARDLGCWKPPDD